MKAKLFVLAISGALFLTSTVLHAEGTNSTSPASAAHKDGKKSMVVLVPPAQAEKLNLTEDQKAKIKAIEESFTKTQDEYYVTHKDEIDAARQAQEKAMAGLKEQRQAAMDQIKALLTPEQVEMAQGRKHDTH